MQGRFKLTFANVVWAIEITCILLILDETCQAQDIISDKQFLDDYDKIIEGLACEAMAQTQGSQMKVNLSRYATYQELAKLAFWNHGNDLTTTKLEFDEDLGWKRKLVDSLFHIFETACPDYAVPYKYMNMFREFAMIYLNSVEPRSSNFSETWESFEEILQTCMGNVKPYELSLKAMKVVGIVGRLNGSVESVELFPPEEKVDAVYKELDWIVDNLWFVFSHAMGTCYNDIPRPAVLAPKFRALFIKDIMRPLMNRWADPGPLQDFGPIVGNFDMLRAQRNIRYCVTASYLTAGITELQLVRPLRVGYTEEGYNSVVNKKTGGTYG